MTLDLQEAQLTLRRGEENARKDVVEQLGRSADPEAVGLLLEAVADESWPVRQSAVEQLAAFEPGALLPRLERALRDDANAGTRNAAMEVYVKLGAGAVAPLLGLLADSNEEVRHFSAVMLGSIGDARAVPALIRALADPDINVRHAAATSLGQIGDPQAVLPLVEVLGTEPWLQYSAIVALGDIGDPRAAPALVALLDEELLRGAALEALGHVAGRESLEHVLPFLYDPDALLRNTAIRAIVAIEHRVTSSGESLDPQVQAALRREGLVDHLLATLGDDDPQNRRTAAVTLGWLKEPRAEGPLIELLAEAPLQEYVTHALVSIGFRSRSAYEHGLQHPEDRVRQGTLRCLAWIAPPEGTELVAPLIHDPSVEVRAEAVAAIGRLDDEDAAMLLFELLSDESELIQQSASDALAHLAPERVTPLMLQALGSAEEPVRVRAIEVLSRLGGAETAAALSELVSDAREGVRRAAVKALGELEAPGTLELLRGALRDESSRVRQQAVLSLGKLRDPEAVPDLLPVLDDPDPRMRFATLRALGQTRGSEAVPAVMGFLDDARKELRFAAVEALGNMRATDATNGLIAVLSEADRSLRRATAESLGAIGDPRATPALMLASEDEHWSVRSAAVAALGHIGSPKALHALLARADDDDGSVRRSALVALGEVGDARAAQRVGRALCEPGLESTAADALGRLGAAGLAEAERIFIFGAASAEVRRLLVNLASRAEEPRARRLLITALADDDAAVRAEAAHALGDTGALEGLRPLMASKSSDPSENVRQAAAQALKKLAPR